MSEKVKLLLELRRKKAKLKTVEKKINVKEKHEPTQGILANLHLLRETRAELRHDIEVAAVNLIAVKDYLREIEDDEDDLEMILLDS